MASKSIDDITSTLGGLRIHPGASSESSGRGRGRGRGRGQGRGQATTRPDYSDFFAARDELTKKMIDYKEKITNKGHQLRFVCGSDKNFEEWQGSTPSKCNVVDGITKIKVYESDESLKESDSFYEQQDATRDKALEEFQMLADQHKPWNRTVTKESVAKIAKKYGHLSGKWLIPTTWDNVDKIWQKLVNGILDGKLCSELGFLYIKVQGRDKPENNPHNIVRGRISESAMVGVVTKDWTDEEATMKVADVICSLGIEENLFYKPDIYTDFKIFRSNNYNMRAAIYVIEN